ncbi:hypothetical protein RHGRI_025736 [Rhododendron griersonianum]|uniref:Uncharacterized protein n=1 Tax=Rhododendron griersonianum TaxID=479676 RepID=A0AAV6IWB3_9ERIC|nr:hypothetical protein RHGRI_025736 [Rhododendron griersonianum]
MNYYYYYSLNSFLSSIPGPNKYPYRHNPNQTTSTVSCSLRRHHRRRKTPRNPTQPKPTSPSADEKLQIAINFQPFSNKASSLPVRKALNEFVRSGNEALEDLTTLIALDADRGVVISCRPSTLRFVGGLVACGFVIVVLVKLGLGFWGKMGFGNRSGVVRRRDRSLGGREVVVATRRDARDGGIRVSENPPAAVRAVGSEEMLPSWWPVSLPPPVLIDEKEQYQRMASRLIRAIMDYRIGGKDILEDDIIQFRRLCRTSGARVSFDTTNGRDSFYRASVHFVFDHCGRVQNHSTSVQIDGEDARQFVAGLADNIGLENTRAARIVSAAVAARTRSCFLQAWALEMQGKHSEAAVELSKICLIHRIFPPEECSPEMEMVAQGLEKHLKVQQREFLMDTLVGVCGKRSHRSMAEALGLVHPRFLLDFSSKFCMQRNFTT